MGKILEYLKWNIFNMQNHWNSKIKEIIQIFICNLLNQNLQLLTEMKE